MSEDDHEAEDDDDLQNGSGLYGDYVSQSNVDDVRHRNPELKSDQPKKIWKVADIKRSGTKHSDGSETRKDGEDNTSRVEHWEMSEQTTSQIRLFDDIVFVAAPSLM